MSYALSQIEEYVEAGMLDGSINAAAAKFFLSRLGWDDKPNQSLTINLTVDQIDNKLRSLVGEEGLALLTGEIIDVEEEE